MIETIKQQLWDLLKEKNVSLVMIYDNEGKILWHKGRSITGKSVQNGDGFSRSFINDNLSQSRELIEKNVAITLYGDNISASAHHLHIKSLIILPVTESFYLYIDSGIKEYFSETEIEVFRTMGMVLARTIERITHNQQEIGGITGSSQKIKSVRQMVARFAMEDEPVLLIGETGVGKTHTAELIHLYSGRKGRFEVAEITSINENLFESTMFGYKKGAFTDAKSDRPGLVQEAEGGTLFIDEVAEIPLSFQSKLLRFIDTRKFRVVGETVERTADIHIVAATNKDLQLSIESGQFREDLYYRLHVLEIEIPPLRDRKEDIKSAVNEMQKLLKGNAIGEGFWDVVLTHQWPGNMRELITVLKRAGILLDSPITGRDMENIINTTSYKRSPTQQDRRIKEAQEHMRQGKSFWETVKDPFLNRDLNRDQVKIIIEEALMETNGKHVSLMERFNIDKKHYKKFMKFLYRNDLK